MSVPGAKVPTARILVVGVCGIGVLIMVVPSLREWVSAAPFQPPRFGLLRPSGNRARLSCSQRAKELPSSRELSSARRAYHLTTALCITAKRVSLSFVMGQDEKNSR